MWGKIAVYYATTYLKKTKSQANAKQLKDLGKGNKSGIETLG